MEFFDAVCSRYSHRGEFLDQGIPEEDLRRIVDAGIRAPSGMNAQTTSFVIVTDPALRAQIAKVLPTAAVRTAPVLVVVLSQHVVTGCGMAFEVEDYAAGVTSMLLAAAALGYASVWMDGMTKAQQVNGAIREILNVPQEKTVRTVLPLGIPARVGSQPARESFEKRCHFNRF